VRRRARRKRRATSKSVLVLFAESASPSFVQTIHHSVKQQQ